MKKALMPPMLVLLSPGMGYPQTPSLTDQIDAVAAVQDREIARQRDWNQQHAEAEARIAAAKAAVHRAAAVAAERSRQAAHDEAMADKKRDQA